MKHCLTDYIHIGANQLLKIKLKNEERCIYGEIKTVTISETGTVLLEPTQVSQPTRGSMQQFLNYEECITNQLAVPAFTRRSVASNDIESVEIIDDEVFG